MNVSDFDFELPEELIAQHPPAERGGSRLIVFDRATKQLQHTTFDRLPAHLTRGDLLVVNDTRVLPARLLGHRVPSGGAVECLLIRRLDAGTLGAARSEEQVGKTEEWEALMHPGQKLKPGAQVRFERGGATLIGEVLARHYYGRRSIRLEAPSGEQASELIGRIGHVPLPPYIKRDDEASDRDRYQTVFARSSGSVAAPTAGLHFTQRLLEELESRAIERTTITLHVGYGTFKPVRVDNVEDHDVDPERYVVSGEAAEALTRAKRDRRRIIAVGTTTTRALESLIIDNGIVRSGEGETRLFIRPGHHFQLVSGLVTNFHLPKSSLLFLAAAFAGREEILAVYRDAVQRRYRFYSYGDAMLIT
ncbi:MAG TPA: tRNA preQ1(34) S-adenosylmethionine ribosyltransferase-isomerase QueA [Vicinamibacterales bacterium]|nr:tRNA preQ1(34) S-adenosylmethionine ribosyltransferase-isomerase QueA [Vicinamibacterales bacterium]